MTQPVHGLLDKLGIPKSPGPGLRPSTAPKQVDSDADGDLGELTPWPDPRDGAAFHGIAGDIIRAIEPHTEADPAALLCQFLATFGNLIGRRAHFVAEATRHYTNLFVVLVGTTSKGRKGTSWDQIRRVIRRVDDRWEEKHVSSGLSSGEGLIWAVRDPVTKQEPIRKGKKIVDYEEIEIEPGVKDKRLLVQEPEFATTLRILERQGNSLSGVIRQAWETGNLRSLVKNSPAKTTNAHISIVGHVTAEEVRRYLSSTEVANGFGNRFLWVCVRRSKCLPDGGCLQEEDLSIPIRDLAACIQFSRRCDELRRDDLAREIWHAVYPELSEGKPGMLGAITARAEAQVMRLACVYALLDRSAVIGAKHLEAALAVWEYAEASARFVFGDALGDPIADELLRALRAARPGGLSRTDIRDLFQRHARADRISAALAMLYERGLARMQMEETDGRPTQRWFAV